MQSIIKNQATASLRRLYFVAVDANDYKTRLQASDMAGGGFVLRLTKNGGTDAAPITTTVTEVGATNMKGVFYCEMAVGDVDTDGVGVLRIANTGGTKSMVQREVAFVVGDANDSALAALIGTPAVTVSADIAAVKVDTAATRTQVNTIAGSVSNIELVQLGKWKIIGTQLILYQNDNTTVFRTFDLKDDSGSPSNTRIFERDPV